MNFGAFGMPRSSGYKDYIFGRSTGTNWELPISAPGECSIPFEFELYDAGSAAAAGVAFTFNNRPQVDHVFQVVTANGTTITGTAGNNGNFASLDPAGLSQGTGIIMVGRSRITWQTFAYRGVPGASIMTNQYVGVLNASPAGLNATLFFTGIQKLIVQHGGTVGFSKNSRIRFFEPQLLSRAG